MIPDPPVLQGIARLTGLFYVGTRCRHGLAHMIRETCPISSSMDSSA
jgi:hypothetical protein